MSDISVRGLKELQAFLDQLPAKLERNILRSALRAGSKVVMDEARRNIPATPPNLTNLTRYGGYAGALRDSLRISTSLKNGRVIASVKMGGKTKRGADVYYARWFEYGTASHVIRTRNKKSLAFGGRLVEGVVHPGAAPHPVLRPALDTQSAKALLAVGNAIKQRLTKAGLEGAGNVEVEVDQ